MSKKLKPLGTVYAFNSKRFGLPIMWGGCKTLKAEKDDTSVVLEVTNGNLLAPNNFGHKAGDGTATRKRTETSIHPALQGQPGATQATYLEVEMNSKCIGGIGEKKSNNGSQFYQQHRIYDSEKVATSLSANLPGGANMYDIKIPVKEATKQGYAIARGGLMPSTSLCREAKQEGEESG